MAIRRSIQQYQINSVNNILDADPHTLISIIYQHILGSLAAAKGSIQRDEIEEKGKNINKAIALIGELIDSLNMEQGGDISNNLAALYDYSVRKLVDANAEANCDLLNEISLIFIDIKAGWDSIPKQQQIKPDAQATIAGI
ncbi:MAG: flagellar protein FliS [Alteromonadaceae bacterium]|jgi:flagellar protein FliS